jgi:hypothetical protein
LVVRFIGHYSLYLQVTITIHGSTWSTIHIGMYLVFLIFCLHQCPLVPKLSPCLSHSNSQLTNCKQLHSHCKLNLYTPFKKVVSSQTVRVRVTLQLTVSMSWCRAQSGTSDQRYFFFLKVTVLSFWGALSVERSGLSFVSLLSIESKVVSEFTYIIYNAIYTICIRHSSVIYNLYKIYNIQGLSQFRLFTADYALVTSRLPNYGSLDT